jgi:hypothetical protein
MTLTQTAPGVPCGICKEIIPDVYAKTSELMTALNYPDKWETEMECLVCNDCRIQARAAKAWLKHAGLHECIKVGRNCE